MSNTLSLSRRPGTKPGTTEVTPHSQLDQHGPEAIVEQLLEWMFSLPNVEEQPSRISVPGARAMILRQDTTGNPTAFMAGREFAHIHPTPDFGSLHLKLAPEDANAVVESGWGEHHLLVRDGRQPPGAIMVFCPRDEGELDAVKAIISRSYQYATSVSR